MTTPSAEISTADVNTENGYGATQQMSFDDTAVRNLAKLTTSKSQISFLDLRNKTRPTSGSSTFTSGSGNFIVPPGVYSITYTIVGGGGGGSAGYQIGGIYNDYKYGSSVGGAGGSGGRLISQTLAVTPGQVIAYSVGAAGSATGGGGYANYIATAGGTTTFAGVTASGGAGGTGYNESGAGGNPGNRSGGSGIGGSPGGLNGKQPDTFSYAVPTPPSIGVPQGGAGVVVNGVTYGTGGNGGPANPNTPGNNGVGGVVHITWIEGFVVTAPQQQMNLFTWLTGQGWPGQTRTAAIINPGVYIWSDSTAAAALTTGGPYPGGLTIHNNGYIMGKGGAGGGAGGAGSAGGTAISIDSTLVTLINYASGWIGGGGGGAGGSISPPNQHFLGGGGGAGGGAGGNGGPAGGAIGTAATMGTGAPTAVGNKNGAGGQGTRRFVLNEMAGGGGGYATFSGYTTPVGGTNNAAGATGTDFNPQGGPPRMSAGGGGGWGASGGGGGGYFGGGRGAGAAGGKAIALNGRTITQTNNGTIWGAVA